MTTRESEDGIRPWASNMEHLGQESPNRGHIHELDTDCSGPLERHRKGLSMGSSMYPLQTLIPFELSAFDSETEHITRSLRSREDELRERYNALFEKLRFWISEGLNGELERAERAMVADRAWIIEKELELENRRQKVVQCIESVRAAIQLYEHEIRARTAPEFRRLF